MKRIKLILAGVLMLSGIMQVPMVSAQSEPFIGQIAWVPYNFAPQGWALCHGQILPINTNQELFSLLGTTYGGNGVSTFALPDMRGRVMVHAGQGPGLSNYSLGQTGGQETVTLTTGQIPAHSHSLNATEDIADSEIPTNMRLAAKQRTQLYSGDTTNAVMDPGSIGATGSGQPHENRPPYLALHCIIALQGVFPSPN